jgi:hypothetical protein
MKAAHSNSNHPSQTGYNPVQHAECDACSDKQKARAAAVDGFATRVAATVSLLVAMTMLYCFVSKPVDWDVAAAVQSAEEAKVPAAEGDATTVRSQLFGDELPLAPGAPTLENAGLLFDLRRIVDRGPQSVARLLGESPVLWPAGDTMPGALKGKYRHGKIEIAYVEEAARLVTIFFSGCSSGRLTDHAAGGCVELDELARYSYDQDAPAVLAALGLPRTQPPSIKTASVTRWNGLAGIHEISVFPNRLGGIAYVQVISNGFYACVLQRTTSACNTAQPAQSVRSSL